MITYFNGSFLPLEDVHVSPFDRGYQFADGVYEALVTYNGRLFLFDEHLARLKRSLGEIRINFNGFDNFKEIMHELIKKNGLSDAVIYLQITRGASAPRMHLFPGNNVQPSVFMSAAPRVFNQQENEKGVKVILEDDIRWDRCDIKSLMLLPSVLAKQKAFENNAYEAIWIRDGFIKEGGHTNIFAVKKDTVCTPPLTNTILPGITRNFVVDLCRKNNINLIEEEIKLSAINDFDEFFLTGTTTEVKPIVQINENLVRDGKPGSVTKMIRELYNKTIA